jgi:hypothetical protein
MPRLRYFQATAVPKPAGHGKTGPGVCSLARGPAPAGTCALFQDQEKGNDDRRCRNRERALAIFKQRLLEQDDAASLMLILFGGYGTIEKLAVATEQ